MKIPSVGATAATQIATPKDIPVRNSRLPPAWARFATRSAPTSAPAPMAIVIQL